MISRRGFFGALAAAAAAGVVDPETLLWTPSAKTIFVPPVSGWAPKLDHNIAFTMNDMAMDPEAFHRLHIKPAVDRLDTEIDKSIEGLSIRMVREFKENGAFPLRIDLLYGMAIVNTRFSRMITDKV